MTISTAGVFIPLALSTGTVPLCLVSTSILTLSSWVSHVSGSGIPLPTTPSSVDTPFSATPNTSYFSQPSPAIALSFPLPSLGSLQSNSQGVSGRGLDIHSVLPPFSPIPPPEHITQHDDGMFVSEDDYKPRRKPRMSRMTSLLSILRRLQQIKFTAIDLLSCIVDGQGEFEGFRNALFSPKNRDALVRLLDKLYQDTKGHPILSDWMLPHSVTLVQEKIHTEMEAAKPSLRMHMSEVTPAFIESWDIHRIMEPVTLDVTPILTSIIESAGESKASRIKSKSTKSKNRATVGTKLYFRLYDNQLVKYMHRQASLIIMAQLHYLRSMYSAKVPIGLGLHAWASGTSRQMISVLHRSCLSVSYPSILSVVHSLAEHSIKRAQAVSLKPHILAYDNVNISSSIFVEQGPNTMSKVQSGTLAVIYELAGACAEDMRILPMMTNLRCSSPLSITDLCPSLDSMRSYLAQTAVSVVCILGKYVQGFDSQLLDTSLQHIPRRPLSHGHKTVFHPLWATTIEEASIDGNLLVHDDVYLVQLKRSPDELSDFAIPSFNDQLTNARIRGGQYLRKKDLSAWERREIFQLGFGTFHLVMNLLWSVLEMHRGSVGRIGSLAFFFAVLEKARLGGEHPDYHTLLSAMKQILHGLILNAWQMECGYPSLRDFSEANPSPEDLLRLADRIIKKYAMPQPQTVHIDPKNPPKDLETGTAMPTQATDTVHNNTTLLTRDLLYVMELVDATASGDFGRIEDVLPTIACMFRGSGSNNYSMEILHLLFNIKEVWTPAFAYVITLQYMWSITVDRLQEYNAGQHAGKSLGHSRSCNGN